MRTRHTWAGATLAALAAVGLASTAAPATGAAPAGAPRAGGQAWAGLGIRTQAVRAALAPAVVTLPTGQRIGLSRGANGAPVTTLLDGKAFAATKAAFGDAAYIIPASVRSVVGSRLDPSLFDVAAIAARPGGRTPVTVTYAEASSPTPVPGVEITARSGLTATGYITPSSSHALGAALATTSADRLFAHVSGVRVSNPAKTTDSRYPMHTLTIKVIGPDGKPMAGGVGYMGLDPSKGVGGFAFANYKGIAKISVPSGAYTLLGSEFSADFSKGYLVLSPEFTVTGPGEATLDFRRATTPVSSTAYRPIADGVIDTELGRLVSDGGGSLGFFLGMMSSTDTRYFVAPTRGRLHGEIMLAQFLAGGSPAGGPSYVGNFAGSRTGRLPDAPIRFAATAGNTMRLNGMVHGPRDLSTSLMSTVVETDASGLGFGVPLTSRTPTRYVSAGTGVQNGTDLYQSVDNATETVQGFQRHLASPGAPGTTVTDHWMTAPMHSRFVTPALSESLAFCSACIKDGMVMITALPMSDADPSHFGNPDVAGGEFQGTYAVLADGAPLQSGDGFLLFSGGRYPAGTTVLSGRQTTTRSGGIFANRTVVTTEFGTPVSAAITVPTGQECLLGDGCRILPMLSADYDATVDLDNRLAAGKQTIGLAINQLGRTRPVGITSVKAWISYDGTSWTAVPVAGSGGHYTATLTVPKAGPGRATVGIKVTASDAAGSTLTETIGGAFLLPR